MASDSNTLEDNQVTAAETHASTESEGPQLAPHIWFNLGPVPFTDAYFGAIFVAVFLSAFGFAISRKFALVPTRFQMFMEVIAGYFLTELEAAFGSEKEARQMFAFIFTLLLFVAVANQMVLLPFVMQITWGGVAIFREPTVSYGGTIALAILVIGASNIIAFKLSPIHQILKFFPINKVFKARSLGDLMNAGIEMFVGLLEIIGELAKTISLASRLFGNLFAGMVMGEVIKSLVPFIVPLPFAAIEIFAGLVQAFVFTLLSIQFIAGTVGHVKHMKHEAHDHDHKPAPAH